MAGSHKIDTAKTKTERFYVLTSDPAEYDKHCLILFISFKEAEYQNNNQIRCSYLTPWKEETQIRHDCHVQY